MKLSFSIISSLLAFAISTSAQLVGITITSPTDGYILPAGSAGSASIGIAYTVAPEPNTAISALTIQFGTFDPNPFAPVGNGKQTVAMGVPSLPPGSYPLTFTEKYTLNQTVLTATEILNIIVPSPSTSAPPPPPPTSSAPATSAPPPPPSSSIVPSSSSLPSSSSSLLSSSSSISPSSSRLSSSLSSISNATSSLTSAKSRTVASSSNSASASANSTDIPAPSVASQNTPLIIASVCGFVAVLAAGFGYAFLSKTRKNRRKDRVFGDDPIGIPPQIPFDRAVGGVVGAPSAEERPDSWEPEVKHAPGALYTTTTAPPPAATAYYNQQQPQGYGDYSQQQYAAGYYQQQQQQQAYPQNPDIQLQNAHNWTGQYPQHNYQGQGDYGYR